MNNLKTFWFNPQTPKNYHKSVNSISSGISDEKIIEKFINNYCPKKNKVIVDLGIGTGRELSWLGKLKKIKKIIGLDYSPAMIDFVKNNSKSCNFKLELVTDDLLKPRQLSKKIRQENTPIIYLSLINTFGNFSRDERICALKNICTLMLPKDRVILALYKRSQDAKLTQMIQKSPRLQTQNPNDQPILAELIEYGLLQFFWTSVMGKYNQIPRFWYDKKGNDVIIHVKGKRLLASHRFSKEEIELEFKAAGFKIDKIIEGKAMWIAVGKKSLSRN